MRTLIKRNFPEHGVIGEEFGNERADAEYVWVLDPIDGTKSFISGMPAWGTLIALTRNGEPVFGMMHQPFIRERFTGDGGAARYRGPAGERELRVRPCASLSDAVLFTTSPLLMNAADRAAFARVESAVRLSRYGGDCYAYCMLAAGHVDLVIETGLKPHDIVALIPIIEGAGGIITNWEGGSAVQGRARHRGRRQARARGRDEDAAQLRVTPSHPGSVHRRARHEGVERGPELLAIAVLLHQDFVPRAGDHQMRAGAQPHRELPDRRRRDDLVLPGGDQQQRLAQAARRSSDRRIRSSP